MSEVLSNTGAKLWSETDYNELWLTVFDQLTGQGGKSNIRLIDEAIGKINDTLDGYKFEFSSVEDRLYISKGDLKLPVSLIDSKGHVASKVDGTTITIDENGIVKGIPVDDALSEESTNPLQNKVIAGELKNIKSKISTDESTIESNTKKIEANETAISTLNGTGDGSVKKAVSDGIAKVVAGAPEDFDTLKEMSDWISTHETSASAMNSQIQDNKKAIDNHVLNGDVHVTPENKTNWNKVFEKLDKTGDASNVTTEFTTATTRSNLTTKEKLSISLGKISKWFSDLKSVAFSGSYNDLNDKPTSLPANGGNSTTVNGHTVNSNVPANAKFTDTTYNDATTSVHGLMTADMVTKLNGIASGANKTIVDANISSTSTNPVQNKVVKNALDHKLNGYTVTYTVPANTGGWHKIAQISDYFNFDLYTNGGWYSASKSIAHFQIQNIHGKIRIVQLSGKVLPNANNGIAKIRMVRVSDDVDTWILEEYSPSSINPEVYTFTMAGILKLTPLDGSVDSTTSFKDSVSLDVIDIPTGHVITTGAVDNTMSDTSEHPVQNKVVKAYVDALKKSVSDGKTKVANAITDKGVDTATDATFDVMAENISKIDTELHGATLSVVTSDKELFGKTVTLDMHHTIVGTTVFSNNGTCSFIVQKSGPYTITCGEAHKDISVTNIDVLNKTTISVNLLLLKIVTFASGTDEEIAKMIQAHYNNKINIADYWAVGDTRTVHLSAMGATTVGESHRAQSVKFVIGGFNHDDLTTPIKGHTKAAVTLLQMDCLMNEANTSNPSANGSNNTENGYMSSRQSNEGGWDTCARRGWCNTYFNALPTAWKSMVKEVNKKTSAGNISSTIITSQDKIFLASEIEIFGSTTYSCSGEGAQYQFYKNATVNRYKNPRWTSTYASSMYFTRSPCKGNTTSFCIVNASGNANTRSANTAAGIPPCLCI